jgi:hypothetical protein
MVRPALLLDDHRTEIEFLLLDLRYSYQQVIQQLNIQDLRISERTLRRRCKEWQISRRQLGLDEAVINKIEWEFHNTYHSDTEIVAALSNTLGLHLSVWQVQRVRLAHEWRRRAANEEQMLAQQADTNQRVENALSESTVRNYGRGHLQAYLLSQQQYPARANNLRSALHTLDKEGTKARQLGPM